MSIDTINYWLQSFKFQFASWYYIKKIIRNVLEAWVFIIRIYHAKYLALQNFYIEIISKYNVLRF